MTALLTTLSQLNDAVNAPTTVEALMQSRFFLMTAVIVLSCFRHRTYRNIYLASLINMPGTVLHEMSHFIVGLLLGAQPTRFNLFPKKNGDSYVMGSVSFRNIRFYNAFPAAMAPLLLLLLAYAVNVYFMRLPAVNLWQYLLFILLETIIIENAVPSPTDFRVAFSSLLGVLLYGVLIFLLLSVIVAA